MSTKLEEDITNGKNLIVIMIELDVFARVSAYVAENKILAALEAESQQILVVEAIKP